MQSPLECRPSSHFRVFKNDDDDSSRRCLAGFSTGLYRYLLPDLHRHPYQYERRCVADTRAHRKIDLETSSESCIMTRRAGGPGSHASVPAAQSRGHPHSQHQVLYLCGKEGPWRRDQIEDCHVMSYLRPASC